MEGRAASAASDAVVPLARSDSVGISCVLKTDEPTS